MNRAILALIRAYRLIPGRGRVFRGRGSSHLAVAHIMAGGSGLAALYRYAIGPVLRHGPRLSSLPWDDFYD
jgi:hypothetical protein